METIAGLPAWGAQRVLGPGFNINREARPASPESITEEVEWEAVVETRRGGGGSIYKYISSISKYYKYVSTSII